MGMVIPVLKQAYALVERITYSTRVLKTRGVQHIGGTMCKCKYKDESACPTDCEEELDAQMMAAVVILVLILVSFAVWSLT